MLTEPTQARSVVRRYHSLRSSLNTPLCCQKGTRAFWPVGSQGHLNPAQTREDRVEPPVRIELARERVAKKIVFDSISKDCSPRG